MPLVKYVAENPPEVAYVQHVGSDITVVNSARISFNHDRGGGTDLSEKDQKLIKYLADNDHLSPFEHCTLTVEIRCPIYISKQIMRHRTFAYNEVSRRYTAEDINFYMPIVREQAVKNKQASSGEHYRSDHWFDQMQQIHKLCRQSYEAAIKDGVCRELARGMLPQNLNTRFVMTGNLRNWAHFVKLRRHEHAQLEVRLIANAVFDIMEKHYPVSTGALLGNEKDPLK